jgi:hypothetical protein
MTWSTSANLELKELEEEAEAEGLQEEKELDEEKQLDDDSASMIRDPSELHQRVL